MQLEALLGVVLMASLDVDLTALLGEIFRASLGEALSR